MGLSVAALVGLGVPVGAMPAVAAAPRASAADFGSATVTAETLTGADQYETAVAISKSVKPSGGASVVYLASGASVADGLSAGPAAARDDGVVLYTTASTLPDATAQELTRLTPDRVEVVGGTSVVADAVLSQVAALLPSAVVERVAGADAYGTAAALSARAFEANSGATYHAVTPGRVMDSRRSLGATLFHSRVKQTFAVGGLLGVPKDAVAVTGNVTVVGSTMTGYVTLAPGLTSGVAPPTSTINFPKGDTRANGVTLPLGPGGHLDAMYWASYTTAVTHLIFDVTGYFANDPKGATFHAVTPGRVLDSRRGLGGALFHSEVKQTFAVGGLFDVPTDALAVTGNLTITGQTQLGYVTVAPSLTSRVAPPTSTINFPLGDNRANNVTVPLGPGGHLDAMYWATNSSSTTHVIFDVTGYFANDPKGATYHAVAPGRVMDSRTPLGATLFHSQVEQTFDVGGSFGVPADAVAVTGNVTVTQQTQVGYVTVAPSLTSGVAPATSTVNFPVGDNRANGITVPLAAGHLDAMYWATNTRSTTHVIFDVTGYFAPDPASGPSHSSATVVIASAESPSDAMLAGSLAAALGAPYLPISHSAVPAATAAELRRLQPDRALVVGDTGSVSASLFRQLQALVPSVERVAGTDTYGTAAAIATRFFAGSKDAIVTTPQSYAGGAVVPLSASRKAPILYADGSDVLPLGTRGVLASLAPTRIAFVCSVPVLEQAEAVGIADGRIAQTADTFHYPTYDSSFHDPVELYTVIKAEEILHPDLVRVFSIGKSYDGHDIWAAKVSSDVAVDEGKPETLIDALHHADEHLGVEQALYLLETLTAGYDSDPFIQRLVNERVTWIVFALNQDGWRYDLGGGAYHLWRKNRQPNSGTSYVGTDLNRNYSYKWGCCGGSSSSPGAWNYRGTGTFSAPETRALRDFVASRVVDGKQRITTHLTLHANGELILYPYSYTTTALPADMTADDHAAFVAMARAMSSLNGYKYGQSSALYITDGDEIDWLYHDYGIFSFTIELYPVDQKTASADDYPPYSVVPAQTARNRNMLLYAIDEAACPYAAAGLADSHCAGAPPIITPNFQPQYQPVEALPTATPDELANPE